MIQLFDFVVEKQSEQTDERSNLEPFIFILVIRPVWVTLNPLKDYSPKNSPSAWAT